MKGRLGITVAALKAILPLGTANNTARWGCSATARSDGALRRRWVGAFLRLPFERSDRCLFELVLAEEKHRPALEELATAGAVSHALAPRVERGARIRVETGETVQYLTNA